MSLPWTGFSRKSRKNARALGAGWSMLQRDSQALLPCHNFHEAPLDPKTQTLNPVTLPPETAGSRQKMDSQTVEELIGFESLCQRHQRLCSGLLSLGVLTIRRLLLCGVLIVGILLRRFVFVNQVPAITLNPEPYLGSNMLKMSHKSSWPRQGCCPCGLSEQL